MEAGTVGPACAGARGAADVAGEVLRCFGTARGAADVAGEALRCFGTLHRRAPTLCTPVQLL